MYPTLLGGVPSVEKGRGLETRQRGQQKSILWKQSFRSGCSRGHHCTFQRRSGSADWWDRRCFQVSCWEKWCKWWWWFRQGSHRGSFRGRGTEMRSEFWSKRLFTFHFQSCWKSVDAGLFWKQCQVQVDPPCSIQMSDPDVIALLKLRLKLRQEFSILALQLKMFYVIWYGISLMISNFITPRPFSFIPITYFCYYVLITTIWI